MYQTYKKDIQVLASHCTAAECMGISSILNEFQDAASAHSLLMNVDGITMRNRSNVFWVILKSKIRVHKTPGFLDTLTIETWPNAPGPVRSCRNFTMASVDGELLVEGRSEWGLLDCTDRTLRKFSSTDYPRDFEHRDTVLLPEPFLRIRETVTDDDFVYSKKIMFSDIDFSGHTNNVVYIDMMMNAFDCQFFKEHEVTEFEIDYCHESREGETVNIYRKDGPDSIYIQLSNPDGKVYAVAVMKVKTV